MALKILHLDSSARGAASHSRQITAEFVQELLKKYSDAEVSYRDFGHEPPPLVNENWIVAGLTPEADLTPEQRAELEYSNTAITELLNADLIVIGSPMYNFGISAALKAYIDQIVRANRTFSYGDNGVPKGLIPPGKKLFIFTARGGGGYEAGEQLERVNHQDSYLRDIFGFIGVTDVEITHLNKTVFGGEVVAAATDQARARIQEFVAA